MKNLKNKLINLIIVLVFLVGAGIMFYPTVSDIWNRYRNEQLISEYDQAISKMSDVTYDRMWKAAKKYQKKHTVNWIGSDKFQLDSDYELPEDYTSVLNPNGDGVIGSIEIPKIGVKLAIYHGMGVTALEQGVGHIEGTSLPIGGKSTHAALSAHRGLPSAKLFTDVDQLVEDDIFVINVLDKKLAYKIDQIKTVEPGEVDDLMIVEGKDYVTLVTCTPYAVNTHRILVRGHRTTYEAAKEIEKNEQKSVLSGNPNKFMLLLCIVIGIAIAVIIVKAASRLEDKKHKNKKTRRK